MFRYDGRSEDELSLLPGDILKPLREVEPGWWAALIGEQNSVSLFSKSKLILVYPVLTDGFLREHYISVGCFPSNYVHCFRC